MSWQAILALSIAGAVVAIVLGLVLAEHWGWLDD